MPTSTAKSSTAPRIVIDALVYHCDGNPEPLKTGGVTAANVTVTHMHWGARQTLDGMAAWLKRVAARGSGWRLVRKAADIRAAQEEGCTGLIMGWQNTLPFGTNLDLVHAFHAVGLRVAQLTYNEANFAGDGCMEPRGGGLTRFGHDLVAAMNAAGVAIDVSHCCDATAADAAKASRKPVLLTHANAKGVDDRPRNKSDATLRLVAATGGVVGTSIHGFMNWDSDPKHPPSLENWIRHVRHVLDLAGVEHVGIGTDFSAVQDEASVTAILELSRDRYSSSVGAYAQAFGNSSAARYPRETPTPRQFPRLIEALERAGFSGAQVDAIAGGNLLRAFRDTWG